MKITIDKLPKKSELSKKNDINKFKAEAMLTIGKKHRTI
jgi:hypothetical protein